MVYSENFNNIKVGAIFPPHKQRAKGNNVLPKWFFWQGRKYDIQSINQIWKDRCGAEKIIRFSVSDGINCYELTYNSSKINWKLKKVY